MGGSHRGDGNTGMQGYVAAGQQSKTGDDGWVCVMMCSGATWCAHAHLRIQRGSIIDLGAWAVLQHQHL